MEVLLCISEHASFLFPLRTWKKYFSADNLKFHTYNHKSTVNENALIFSVKQNHVQLLEKISFESLRTDVKFLDAIKDTLVYENGYFVFDEERTFGKILYKIVEAQDGYKIKLNDEMQEILE